jgi:hypothetical protein
VVLIRQQLQAIQLWSLGNYCILLQAINYRCVVVTGDKLIAGVMDRLKSGTMFNHYSLVSPVSLTPVNDTGNKDKVANISANFENFAPRPTITYSNIKFMHSFVHKQLPLSFSTLGNQIKKEPLCVFSVI